MGVKELRKALGYTQEQTAALCGVCRKTVWNWEQGKTRTPTSAIKVLKQELKEKGHK